MGLLSLATLALLAQYSLAWGVDSALLRHKTHKHAVKDFEQKFHNKKGTDSSLPSGVFNTPALVKLAATLHAALNPFFEDHTKDTCFKGWKESQKGYISGCADGCKAFPTLEEAKTACVNLGSGCGGVLDNGNSDHFELRQGSTVTFVPGGVSHRTRNLPTRCLRSASMHITTAGGSAHVFRTWQR